MHTTHRFTDAAKLICKVAHRTIKFPAWQFKSLPTTSLCASSPAVAGCPPAMMDCQVKARMVRLNPVQIGANMIFYVCSRLPQLRPGPIDRVEEDTCSQLNSGALLGVWPHPGSVTYIFAYICHILVHVHMCKDRTIMRHKLKVMTKWHHPTGPQDIESGESDLERRTSQRAQHHQK